MTTSICIIRHGQTDWNKSTLIQGTVNNRLNENGRDQAHAIGKYLKENDTNWDVIIASPLARAYETASIIRDHLDTGIELIADEDFVEREFGEAEGKKIEPVLFNKIIADEIPGLEKSHDLQNRVHKGVLKIAKLYPGKRVLIVAHSHVIKGLLTKLDKKYSFNDEMINSALNFFTVDNETITINAINQKVHLQNN